MRAIAIERELADEIASRYVRLCQVHAVPLGSVPGIVAFERAVRSSALKGGKP